MAIHRRQFLQFAASTLATLGISQLDIQKQGLRYARVLAQPTSRKLALLVGVNEYQQWGNLEGCVTDVELQQNLLIHRFGFNPSDIQVLSDQSDQKPTRENILTVFDQHLIKQAKPGDVVVFHFSGHGSRVVDPTPRRNLPDPYNSTFVTADADGTSIPDIMGKTLFLLLSALQTEHITAVLDCCYSGGGTRGNVRVRSVRNGFDGQDALQPSPIELAYQQQWLSRLGMDPEQFAQQRDRSARGVILAAAQHDQEAIDATFDRFDAGVFTCFLTQYLWQQTTPTVSSAVASVSRSIQAKQFAQVPFPDVQANSSFEQQPIYFVDQINAASTPPAEAVLVKVNGNRGTVWLGGIDPTSLAAFDAGASFTVASAAGQENIKLLSRNGLTGEVSLSGAVAAGTLLQEASRAIPRDLKLRIGLDPSLEIDTASAQQALQSIHRIEPVPAQSGRTPYAAEVQYILTQMTPRYQQRFQQQGVTRLPEVGSIGLVSQSIDEIIPDSFGKAGESVEDAIARLAAKLTALVAARIVKLTLNANSSRLSLEASMQPEDQTNRLIAEAFTPRGASQPKPSTQTLSHQIPLCTPFQFQVVNREPTELYLSILVIDPSGEIIVLFPNNWTASEDVTRIAANQTLLIPDADRGDPFQMLTLSKGIGEALIIASRAPLRQALITLRNLAANPPQSGSESQEAAACPELESQEAGAPVTKIDRGPIVPSIEAIGDLLSDLSGKRGSGSATDSKAEIHVAEIAALSITFEVI